MYQKLEISLPAAGGISEKRLRSLLIVWDDVWQAGSHRQHVTKYYIVVTDESDKQVMQRHAETRGEPGLVAILDISNPMAPCHV